MARFRIDSTPGISTMVGAAIAIAIVVLGLAFFLGAEIFTAPTSSPARGQSSLLLTLGTSSSTAAPPAGASTIYVKIMQGASISSRIPASDPGISPSAIMLVIGVNNTVIWTNYDDATHTVTANDGSFDSKDLKAGQTFSYSFTVPGTFNYHCIYHSWMTGQVIVKSGK
jgi:plastocyanin